MNRAERRAAAAKRQRQAGPRDPRASIVQIFAGMAADDPSIAGATLIEPSGQITFLNAELLRRGGSA